jgi:hypothetical protein
MCGSVGGPHGGRCIVIRTVVDDYLGVMHDVVHA